ncbi:hypothetical protein Pcinc_043175 [Petrolisthes cinctipes]|uniref:Uncharacterized protein n=1 Tax=Petrolisthes cinctipes TaxID=88211 RepID=A0AAE1BG94_PETCI|nr:hypothetical protein Pcinc_043175 [Petrolisthes cinctipes]
MNWRGTESGTVWSNVLKVGCKRSTDRAREAGGETAKEYEWQGTGEEVVGRGRVLRDGEIGIKRRMSGGDERQGEEKKEEEVLLVVVEGGGEKEGEGVEKEEKLLEYEKWGDGDHGINERKEAERV